MNTDPVWRICAYSECKIAFETAVHNQKYCCDDHCRLATNARIMEKYYERKARRGGKKRICESRGCTTVLSRYNASKYCAKCEGEKETNAKNELLAMVS